MRQTALAAEMELPTLSQKQLKHTRIFEARIRELQSACSNLEPPVSPKGTSLSFREVQAFEDRRDCSCRCRFAEVDVVYL